MIQLRQMGYFKKEDIQKYGLVLMLRTRRVILGKAKDDSESTKERHNYKCTNDCNNNNVDNIQHHAPKTKNKLMKELAPHNAAGNSEAHIMEGTTRRRQQRINNSNDINGDGTDGDSKYETDLKQAKENSLKKGINNSNDINGDGTDGDSKYETDLKQAKENSLKEGTNK